MSLASLSAGFFLSVLRGLAANLKIERKEDISIAVLP